MFGVHMPTVSLIIYPWDPHAICPTVYHPFSLCVYQISLCFLLHCSMIHFDYGFIKSPQIFAPLFYHSFHYTYDHPQAIYSTVLSSLWLYIWSPYDICPTIYHPFWLCVYQISPCYLLHCSINPFDYIYDPPHAIYSTVYHLFWLCICNVSPSYLLHLLITLESFWYSLSHWS